ncbi:RcpC/CpaB family pilus assembly protein [Vibrio hepatarius]|uniref:RcpC/CpaB family pilus assembly protein n=1 Tax=Vibrio hepatarius TaxID=171383 RepID=UPI001C093679|nr:RcpC/CpaB family pilus assembly protein [Vibrio hepatarius]MBU2896203.1 hypothetical protein [Vibrio hepatarius]
MNRDRLTLIFFVITLGVILFLTDVFSDEKPVEKKVDNNEAIVVTKIARDISEGELITPSDIEFDHMSPEEASILGVSSGQTIQIIPQTRVNRDLSSGEIIKQYDLISFGMPGYSKYLLKPGEVVFYVDTSEQKLTASMISPGDNVDVYTVIKDLSKIIPSVKSEKQVMLPSGVDNKVNQILSNRKILSIDYDKENSNIIIGVEIAVTKDQLSRLVVGKNVGQILIYQSLGNDEKNKSFDLFDVAPKESVVIEMRG